MVLEVFAHILLFTLFVFLKKQKKEKRDPFKFHIFTISARLFIWIELDGLHINFVET